MALLIVVLFALPALLLITLVWFTNAYARALLQGREAARDPMHRVAPAGVWFFFNWASRRTRRMCWVVWSVVSVAIGVLAGAASQLGAPEMGNRSGELWAGMLASCFGALALGLLIAASSAALLHFVPWQVPLALSSLVLAAIVFAPAAAVFFNALPPPWSATSMIAFGLGLHRLVWWHVLKRPEWSLGLSV